MARIIRVIGKNSMIRLNPISRQREQGNFQRCSGKVLLTGYRSQLKREDRQVATM